MNPHVSWLDLSVLGVYFASVLGIGAYFYRSGQSNTAAGFTAASGSMPGWVVGLSILATYVSSISFLALPGRAFAGNWNAFVFSLSIPLAAWIAVNWFLPYYRASDDVSAYSHLEKRFGRWARLYAGVCYLLTQLARIGSVSFLMALPTSMLLGWDIRLIIVLTGAVVIAYSMLGGIVAVIWTDAIQTVVLVGGAMSSLIYMVFNLPEGPSQALEIAHLHDKFSLGSFNWDMTESTFWVVLIYGLTLNLQNFGIDQNYVQRYVASRSDAEARKSVWIGALLYVPISAIFFIIGTALFAFYTARPELLPSEYRHDKMADRVFPYFIVTQLPAGVTGLLIAAIFSAAMSTISTSLNSSATLLLTDFYKRYLRPVAGEKESMLVLYLGTAVWGVLGTGVALAMINVRAALDAWWSLSGIFAGGILGLFLLGLVSRRAGNPAAVTGVIAGVLVILWMTFSTDAVALPEGLRNPFHGFMVVVVGTLTILAVGLVVARFTSRPKMSD